MVAFFCFIFLYNGFAESSKIMDSSNGWGVIVSFYFFIFFGVVSVAIYFISHESWGKEEVKSER